MEGFYWEVCGILGEPHLVHCMHLLGLILLIGVYPWRAHLWRHFLLFLEVYIILFHGVLAWSRP
jgi:hypothetical protein